jgi:enamine deaminase RidA (YjgF/YER057c/UK114 family)
MTSIDQRLSDLGVTLPAPAAPVASYVPFVISGKTLYISGQLPSANGEMIKGCLGKDVSIEKGQEAAKLCAINILAQAKAAAGGDFSKIVRLVKLGGFVAGTPEFFDHPKVLNGASDFLVAALGDAGKHARFAVGVAALPFGAAVEIDAIFEVA